LKFIVNKTCRVHWLMVYICAGCWWVTGPECDDGRLPPTVSRYWPSIQY